MDIIFIMVLHMFYVLVNSIQLPESCALCQCKTKRSSVCGLENRIAWLERNMMAVDGKIAEWVKQQYHIRALEAQIIMQKGEISELKKRVYNFEGQSKLQPPMHFLNQSTENKPRTIIPRVSESEIYKLSQNLSSLHRRMDNMESKIVKNLTLEIIGLKEFHTAIETGVNKTKLIERFNTLSSEFGGIRKELTSMEVTIDEQRKMFENGLESMEKDVASVKTVLSFTDTWQRTLNAFNETLSKAQVDIENIMQELSAEEVAGRKLEMKVALEQIKLEKLSKDMTNLQESIHKQDTKFSNSLSLIMDDIKYMNERQENYITNLQDYLHSSINGPKEDTFGTSSSGIGQSYGNGNNFSLIMKNNNFKQEYRGRNGQKENYGQIGYERIYHNCRNGCLRLDLSQSQHLTFNPTVLNIPCYEVGYTLRFKCNDQLKVYGPTTATCLKSGEWSVTSLPSCVIPM